MWKFESMAFAVGYVCPQLSAIPDLQEYTTATNLSTLRIQLLLRYIYSEEGMEGFSLILAIGVTWHELPLAQRPVNEPRPTDDVFAGQDAPNMRISAVVSVIAEDEVFILEQH